MIITIVNIQVFFVEIVDKKNKVDQNIFRGANCKIKLEK